MSYVLRAGDGEGERREDGRDGVECTLSNFYLQSRKAGFPDDAYLFISPTPVGSVPSFVRSSKCLPMLFNAETLPCIASGSQSSSSNELYIFRFYYGLFVMDFLFATTSN